MMRIDRTTAALILTAAAVTAPCGAWYVTGSRSAEQEAKRIVEAPRQAAQRTAQRLAERVAARLENLRLAESRRPFEHYASDAGYRDETCDCGATVASPLAEGLSDPLVRAHFQIDGFGRLTLPTLEQRLPAPREATWLRDQRTVLEQLECSAPAATSLTAGLEAAIATANLDEGAIPEIDGRRVAVGTFQWRTVLMDDEPGLLALRGVTTPVALLKQGFVVSSALVEQSLDGGSFTASFAPGPPGDETSAAVPLEGVEWHVRVDAAEATALAALQAGTVRAKFRRTFAIGTLAALIAGACVVGLIWQTERLARQRAGFAAAAAHELRTPLTGIRMYGEMLAEGLGDPARRGNYATRIADEAGRLGRVVNNVLGYTRLEQGMLSTRTEAGDLARAAVEVADQLRPALEAAGAALSVEAAPDLPSARFDRDAVAQILQNLLDNGEKYSREGPDRRLEVRVGRESGGIALTVRDHGPGVPPGLRGKLFRPFARPDDPDAPPGLGLGLPIVRALAEAQGARVRYRDADGGGAAFTVVFPIAA